QGREQRRHHRRIADPLVESHPDDDLELLRIAGRARRIERADLLPVVATLHGAAGAGTVSVGADLVALDAAPLFDRIPPGRRALEEVGAIPLVEAQRRLSEASRIAVDLGEVPPYGVGDAVDGLVVDGGEHALAPAHRLHIESAPWLRIGRPWSSMASKAMPCAVGRTTRRTTVDGGVTMPVNRTLTPCTPAASPRRSRLTMRVIHSASVAVPCRMIPGSPAARATASSVWMGFQIRAHSV